MSDRTKKEIFSSTTFSLKRMTMCAYYYWIVYDFDMTHVRVFFFCASCSDHGALHILFRLRIISIVKLFQSCWLQRFVVRHAQFVLRFFCCCFLLFAFMCSFNASIFITTYFTVFFHKLNAWYWISVPSGWGFSHFPTSTIIVTQ